MNRGKIISLIEKSQDKTLNDELDYYMDVDREYDYDLADALDDAYTFAEEHNEKKLIKTIRLILIKAGFLVEAPDKTDFGRDTRITVNKVKYNGASHWEGWLND